MPGGQWQWRHYRHGQQQLPRMGERASQVSDTERERDHPERGVGDLALLR